jgi:dissimilatory sulfite reductase (desulfoviridin) alpha/beta subunit
MGRHPQFAEKLLDLIKTEEVFRVFSDLIKYYQSEREEKEKLGALLNRVGKKEVKKNLAL